jgi:hypothetical protein
MKRTQTVIVCDHCGREESSPDLGLPTGWQGFRNPDIHAGSDLLAFDANYCASLWFNEHIDAAFATARAAESQPELMGAAAGSVDPDVDDIRF